MKYLTSCVDCGNGPAIEAMTDCGREVTLGTIRRHCDDLAEWETQAGYGRHFPLSGDYHVTYHKSTYRGHPCYYVCHSAIEYIWNNA